MAEAIPGALVQVAIAPGDREAVAALQDLFSRCPEFVELTEGRGVLPDEAERELRALPPDVAPRQKQMRGLVAADQPGRLVGAIDLVAGYPGPTGWCIGLLLLDPAWRGRGHGARVVAALEDEMRAAGGKVVWLAVHPDNRAGLRFWQRVGYAVVDQRPRQDSPAPQLVYRLRKSL